MQSVISARRRRPAPNRLCRRRWYTCANSPRTATACSGWAPESLIPRTVQYDGRDGQHLARTPTGAPAAVGGDLLRERHGAEGDAWGSQRFRPVISRAARESWTGGGGRVPGRSGVHSRGGGGRAPLRHASRPTGTKKNRGRRANCKNAFGEGGQCAGSRCDVHPRAAESGAGGPRGGATAPEHMTQPRCWPGRAAADVPMAPNQRRRHATEGGAAIRLNGRGPPGGRRIGASAISKSPGPCPATQRRRGQTNNDGWMGGGGGRRVRTPRRNCAFSRAPAAAIAIGV